MVARSVDLNKPVLVVAINYRLNLFGFAASADLLEESGSCNYGIYDQKIALEWIHKHITGFGGDPAKITVAGQSAGAISVNAQINLSSHLFQRAIIQSGAFGTLGPYSLARHNEAWLQICQYFGLTEHMSAKERVTAMRSLSAAAIVKALYDLNLFTFSLLEDDALESRGIQDDSDKPNCELLAGYTARESMGTFEDFMAKKEVVDIVASLNTGVEGKQLSLEYQINYSDEQSVRKGAAAFLGDLKFAKPLQELWTNWCTQKKGKLYPYYVDHGNPFEGSRMYGHPHHCVDLVYIFNAFRADMDRASERDRMLMNRWSAIWIEFISSQKDDPVWRMNEDQMLLFENTGDLELVPCNFLERRRLQLLKSCEAHGIADDLGNLRL